MLTPDASKALDELGPFLALVCDYLQRGSKFLVVVSKPLQQGHALDQLMFLPRLMKTNRVSNTWHDEQLLSRKIAGISLSLAELTSLSVK